MHEQSQSLIELSKVSRVFRTETLETLALDEIDLSIDKGEYVAISGPSGCGKTTLLSILGLLDEPTNGKFTLAGEAVASLGRKRRAVLRNRQIGFIFQSFNLIDDLSVRDNVELPLTYRAMVATERRDRVHQALERVGMTNRAEHFPSQLSGGQQQRAAVARAIAGSPAILLADEPTGNLDSKNSSTIMDLLGELHADGATICIVTHDQQHAGRAERTVHLLDGRIRAEKTSLPETAPSDSSRL